MRPLDTPVQALIFDMDGLLVDSEPFWFEVEREVVAAHGHEWTEHDARQCIGHGLPHAFAIWRERFGIDEDPETLTRRMNAAMIARAHRARLLPGAQRLLETAHRRKVPLALASSSGHALIAALLDATGVRPFFSHVLSGEDVPHPKPAPDIFLLAAERLGVPPAEALVLEDSLSGVRAARAAGCPVIAVPSTNGDTIRTEATRVASDLAEACDAMFG